MTMSLSGYHPYNGSLIIGEELDRVKHKLCSLGNISSITNDFINNCSSITMHPDESKCTFTLKSIGGDPLHLEHYSLKDYIYLHHVPDELSQLEFSRIVYDRREEYVHLPVNRHSVKRRIHTDEEKSVKCLRIGTTSANNTVDGDIDRIHMMGDGRKSSQDADETNERMEQHDKNIQETHQNGVINGVTDINTVDGLLEEQGHEEFWEEYEGNGGRSMDIHHISSKARDVDDEKEKQHIENSMHVSRSLSMPIFSEFISNGRSIPVYMR